jgi:hypothetical protein
VARRVKKEGYQVRKQTAAPRPVIRERITPTGWGQAGATVKQLGSRKAVLEAVPNGAVVFVKDQAERSACLDELADLGRAGSGIKLTTASWPMEVWERKETVAGVTPGAFDRLEAAVWADVHKAMGRFQMVHWG